MCREDTSSLLTFNRTYKELKLSQGNLYDISGCTFNRTYKELKPRIDPTIPAGQPTFNRTYKELKQLIKDKLITKGDF